MLFSRALLILVVLPYLTSGTTTRILSNHDNKLGPEPCAVICSGTTGKGRTDWDKWDDNTIYHYVNLAGCHFTTTPTITTSLNVAARSEAISGTSQVAYASKYGFRVYLHGFHDRAEDLTEKFAEDRDFSVNWLAIGFDC